MNIRIGYFSGSKTHQVDFQACEKALLITMEKFPETIFRLVGHLDLGNQWGKFAHRVERLTFMPPKDMLQALSECDINIAPLEVGNPFCEAKSALKYFEAAIVGVPTIASATEPFCVAIRDGDNGFIASTSDEWEARLAELIGDRDRRTAMGAVAKNDALANHSLKTLAECALQAYQIEPNKRLGEPMEGKLRIDWIIPGLIIGGGGHRNI
jgi:glycosyltransferase involved in cell wall biosynthesis